LALLARFAKVDMDIEVTRPKQFTDFTRSYRLLADGREVALIERGTTQKVTLPADSKILTAYIDWCYSPDFAVSDIQDSRIVVKNAFASNPLKALLLPLYYVTFGKHKYLKIES
jgi:hypothetical protein|tara:strand:+ start:262 stop:603 length:342 start_codon:yes stop_codon:yes gene_type:complete